MHSQPDTSQVISTMEEPTDNAGILWCGNTSLSESAHQAQHGEGAAHLKKQLQNPVNQALDCFS
jgi:hypothetical protein